MKQLFSFLLCCLLSVTMALGQSKTVSGVVTDAKSGEPIFGAALLVKGVSGSGAMTDASGKFTLKAVRSGATLVVSCLGYQKAEVPVAGQTHLSIKLAPQDKQLETVVVTALGIKRSQKALGYALQEVKGDALTTVREPNITNALSGKVSGIQIIKGSSGPGSSSKIVLRGSSSLSGSNQPLIVVDGVPMDNTTGSSGNDFWNPEADMGNGLSDINPEDIESLTVLKGASAAALYGSRAGNGVIQITTKSGRKNQGLGITISSSVGVETLFMTPRLQNTFGQGDRGAFKPELSSSWGPRIEGQEYTKWDGSKATMQAYDNAMNYFRSGLDLTENIAFSQMYDKSTIYTSLTRTDNKSHIPGASLGRTNLMLRATTKFGKDSRWSTDTKVQYIRSSVQNRPLNGANASNAFYTMYSLPRSMDIRDFAAARTATGAMLWYGAGNQVNPYWASQYNLNHDTRDRFLINAALKYRFTDWLNGEVRFGSDQYTTQVERKTYAGSPIVGGGGSYTSEQSKFFENNYSFLLSAHKDNLFDKLGLSGSLGGNMMERQLKGIRAQAAQLAVDNLFTLTNSKNIPVLKEPISHKKINSLYGTAQLSWDGYFFLDGTLRNDWSSSLAKANRSFLYPSLSASLVVTDMLRKLDVGVPQWLSFAKLRASMAQVGNDLEPYQIFNTYKVDKDPLGYFVANSDGTLYSDKVRSELIKSTELGLELRFLDSRFGLDLAWYRSNATNQLIYLPMDPASGFSSKIINAGNIQNEGFELMVNADIVRSRDFRWSAQLNLSHNENKIIRLYDGGGVESPVREYNLGTYDNLKILAREGGKYGEIWGVSYQRVEDPSSPLFGKIIVDENGLPLAGATKKLGDQQPDLLAGLTNTLHFRGFDLSFLIDARLGGKMFSGTNHALQAVGNAEVTAQGDRAKFVVDGAIASTSNGVTTYSANTKAVDPQDYWTTITSRGGNLGINEANIYDASSIRLRNIALSYTLPSLLLKKTPFQKVKLGVSCNNVLMLMSHLNGVDPESVFATGTNATGYEFASSPTTRSFLFNVTLGF